MSLKIGHKQSNWRLGPDDNPGWFNTSDAEWLPGKFAIATVFKLHWDLSQPMSDGIYNLLHAVTIGHLGRAGKTHIEQLAQILHGDLHITCRFQDSTGQVHRHTVALPGSKNQYLGRTMLLLYTSNCNHDDPTMLYTTNVLYDFDTLNQIQCVPYNFCLQHTDDVNFASWPGHRVICDHEHNHVPKNHVNIHGHCNQHNDELTSFELFRIWGSLGQTLDPLNLDTVSRLTQNNVSDYIGGAQAWYNCACDRWTIQDTNKWALCTGFYQQTHALGIKLATMVQNQYNLDK
jgi:hypothetical protein